MKKLYQAVSLLVAVGIPGIVFAQVIPSTADVSRVGQQMQQGPAAPSTSGGVAAPATQAKFQATPGAEKVKFYLKGIQLEGNTVYSYQDLAPLFQNYVGHQVSLADLEGASHEITLKYRNSGYVLSRAVIPAQTIKSGVVVIQIIEGYVGHVNPVGYVQGSGPLVNKYGQKIAQSKPLNINTLERYALLANDIPGMNQVKVVLQPPSNPRAPLGSTELSFAPDFSKASGFFTIDNRGTRYLGQNEFSAGATVNSIIQSGDQFGVQALSSSNQNERYVNAFDLQPIGTTGATFNLSASYSKTTPGFLLSAQKVDGWSKEVVGTFRVPVIRSRRQNLYTNLSFDYLNSETDFDAFNPPVIVYQDHVRSVRLGADYYLEDSWAGANQISGQLSHGFNVLAASPREVIPPPNPSLSRLQGDPQYTKFNGTLSRLQGITQNLSFLAAGIGQYTNQPLLSSEQFTFGGAQYGSAYDPGELTGDRGVAAKAELRYNTYPAYRFLSAAQYYAYYDIGKIWNILPQFGANGTGIQQSMSAASTGAGVRVNFNPYVYGSVVYTLPLTKPVSAYGNFAPRIFFSITFTGKTPSATDEGSLPGIDRPPVGYSGGSATNGPNARAAASSGI